jgi:hypothetical protein
VIKIINKQIFKSDKKYLELSSFIVNTIEILDGILENKGYLYKAIWRDDKEPGGHVFIFEVERRKGRRKNLITLRPQHSFLRVEVYLKETDKRYFDIYEPKNLPDKLVSEIEDMYARIAF